MVCKRLATGLHGYQMAAHFSELGIRSKISNICLVLSSLFFCWFLYISKKYHLSVGYAHGLDRVSGRTGGSLDPTKASTKLEVD